MIREVTPFTSRIELQQAMDNGGRFYNLFSKPGDFIVTPGELAKASGMLAAGKQAILFLEIAKSELSHGDQMQVLDILEPTLRDRYEAEKPHKLSPSEIDVQGAAEEMIVVTGYPRFLEDQTRINGYVAVPVYAGTITTYTMVPIVENYNVYEFFDEEQMQSEPCLVAVIKPQTLEEGRRVRIGGLLHELKPIAGAAPPSHPYYLEALFYMPLKPLHRSV